MHLFYTAFVLLTKNIINIFVELDNAIDIRELSKHYFNTKKEKIIALDKVSFKVKKGSCCALLGPNGAGKSTLINILATTTKKTSGEVKVHNFDLDINEYELKWKIGIVPQEISLDVFFPIKDVLRFTAGYYNVCDKEKKIDALLKSLSLWDKRHLNVRELSGGMKRRLLMARALIYDPDILVLDEPTAGVDIELREQIYSYIQQLKQQGKTILITTHYLQEAEALCDRFIFINKGNILVDHLRDHLWKNSKEVIIELQKEVDNIEQYFANYKISLHHDKKILSLYLDSSQSFALLLQDICKLGENVIDVKTSSMALEQLYKQVIRSK